MAKTTLDFRVKLTYNAGEVMVMAEFCLECWNTLHNTKHTEDEFVLSKELDLCEGCGELRHVIVKERSGFLSQLIHMILHGNN